MERPERTGRWRLVTLALAMAVLVACGASSGASPTTDAAGTTSEGSAPEAETTIEGLWMQVHTCDQLVAGLEDAGLGALVPGTIGDFFPDTPPEELAAKDDRCDGARPQRHFHFFTSTGDFGSLDQHKEQVDYGPYTVEGDTLHIGDETWGGAWTFEIVADRLSLTPMIDDDQIDDALADPFSFSTAGWMVAVAYPNTTWKRVPCRGWC